MKILLTGKNGQVGYELAHYLTDTNHELVSVRSTDCNLSKPAAIRDLIQTVRPDVMINSAAYTAVDRAESEPDSAKAINADAPEVMASELKRSRYQYRRR